MFTANIQGKQNVKLLLIFFKTGYVRVTKTLAIIGQFKG